MKAAQKESGIGGELWRSKKKLGPFFLLFPLWYFSSIHIPSPPFSSFLAEFQPEWRGEEGHSQQGRERIEQILVQQKWENTAHKNPLPRFATLRITWPLPSLLHRNKAYLYLDPAFLQPLHCFTTTATTLVLCPPNPEGGEKQNTDGGAPSPPPLSLPPAVQADGRRSFRQE